MTTIPAVDRAGRTLHQARIAIMLFAFCAGLYFFTYSGTSISEDELILFDGVHSLAQHGNTWLAYANSARPPQTLPNNAPLSSVDSEPGQIYAALPLFGLAELIPGWGLMQTVWLFNILITALTVVVFYYYAIALGYRDSVAIGASLLLAAGTTLWPYTKTFFREPLSALLILIAAYCLMQARRQWKSQSWRWAIGLGMALSAAVATKATAILIVPALIAIAWPTRRPVESRSSETPESSSHPPIRRRTIIIAGVVAVLAIGAVLALIFTFGQRYGLPTLFNRFWTRREQAAYALISYFASLGRSIWAFSPILLLGFGGVYWLGRARAWRQIVVPLLALSSFAVGYAAFQNDDWYGGLSWGPRYLLVIVPFVALWLLPVLDRLLSRRAGRWLPIAAALLITISVGVQILGVLPIRAYYGYLGAENVRLNLPPDTINGWQAGTWQLNYIPATVLTRLALAGQAGADLAWEQVSGAWPIGVLCAILCGGALLGLIRLSRLDRRLAPNPRRWPVGWLRWIGATVGLFALGITIYQNDPRYADDPSIRAGLVALDQHLRPGDGVLLNDQAYRFTFMNFYKSSTPIMVLPDSPGEVIIPGQPPAISDPDGSQPDALVAPVLPMRLSRFALLTRRWWLITEFIPADPNRLRVTERYLTRHYFPIGELYTSNRLRIVGFSPQSAPPAIFPPWPSVRSGITFGDRFTLIGYDAPTTITIDRSTNGTGGATLPISLLWKFDGWPTASPAWDYSLNVSLIAPDGVLVPGAQQAGTPLGTFGLTSTWVAGGAYRDNHGLALPPNLPAGQYHVWLIWYDWRNNHKLPLTGGASGDHLDLYTVTVR